MTGLAHINSGVLVTGGAREFHVDDPCVLASRVSLVYQTDFVQVLSYLWNRSDLLERFDTATDNPPFQVAPEPSRSASCETRTSSRRIDHLT